MERLNRFLFASTQANKYVTLFYAELDPRPRRLAYVNAGHVPPYRLRRTARMSASPPADPPWACSRRRLRGGRGRARAGDVVAMVTDGVTEALSPADEEFGDERAAEALAGARGGNGAGFLRALVRP